jgi:type VI secretion system protein ImpF
MANPRNNDMPVTLSVLDRLLSGSWTNRALAGTVGYLIDRHLPAKSPVGTWNWTALQSGIAKETGIKIDLEPLMAHSMNRSELEDAILDQLRRRYLPTRTESVRQLRAAVRRDLEWLFNTRQAVQEAPPGATDLENSVYSFGLPDLCSLNLTSAQNRAALARMMETAIAKYDRRLLDVKVTALPAAERGLPQLRFLIEGTLAMEPMPEHVRFDTVLKTSDGSYQVSGESNEG